MDRNELISDLNKPWIMLGDFNAIVSPDKKVGGRKPSQRATMDFSSCLYNHKLIQALNIGMDFSSSNCQHGRKKILCVLDSVVFNLKFLQLYNH